MDLPKLYRGKLIKRYKRFLVDVYLEESNEVVVAHCPNSGSMLNLNEENLVVYVSKNTNPLNKLLYKLELVETKENILVGINTSITNKLVYEGFKNKTFSELTSFIDIKSEVSFNNSRFDFYLTNNHEKVFLEVKNVTLSRQNLLAEFPDCKTLRGEKHLQDLVFAKKNNFRSINLYIIQREDTTKFSIAKDLDAKYYSTMIEAKKNGVEFLCYNCIVNTNEIKINKNIPILT
jgi:sugar fermentation stimulation protein A